MASCAFGGIITTESTKIHMENAMVTSNPSARFRLNTILLSKMNATLTSKAAIMTNARSINIISVVFLYKKNKYNKFNECSNKPFMAWVMVKWSCDDKLMNYYFAYIQRYISIYIIYDDECTAKKGKERDDNRRRRISGHLLRIVL